MSRNPEQALTRAVEDTFEGLAFAQILEQAPVDRPPSVKQGDRAAHIDLPDPPGLRLTLLMTRAHLLETFQTVNPGLDASASSELVLDDFIKELTNTIAGHLMTLLEPDRRALTIGLPAMTQATEIEAAFSGADGVHAFRYRIEGHDLHTSTSSSPT